MLAVVMIVACVMFLFWPAVAAQMWATRQIARHNFKAQEKSPDWLAVGFIASCAVVLIAAGGLMSQFSGFTVAVWFGGLVINLGSLKSAERRIGRAGQRTKNGRDTVTVMD